MKNESSKTQPFLFTLEKGKNSSPKDINEYSMDANDSIPNELFQIFEKHKLYDSYFLYKIPEHAHDTGERKEVLYNWLPEQGLQPATVAVLKNYGLSNFEVEFSYIGHFASHKLSESKLEDFSKKESKKYYKEMQAIAEFFKKGKTGFNKVKDEQVTDLIIHTDKATLKITHPITLNIFVIALFEYYNLHFDKKTKYPDSHNKIAWIYEEKGRPASIERLYLKKLCRAICDFLDSKNKLMPNTGKETSDARRKFIADFFYSLSLLSKGEFNQKEYINSLLNS